MRNLILITVAVASVLVGAHFLAGWALPNNDVTTVNYTSGTDSADKPASEVAPVVKQKQIRTLTLKAKDTITLFEQVGGRNSEKIAYQIREMNASPSKDPIILLLDSPGGSVIAGSKIISAIEASKRPVYTVCVTLCASMAAMIHSYGHKRMNVDRSILMYHNATGGVQGEVPNMLSLLHTLDRYIKKMDKNVIARSKLNERQYYDLVLVDFWVDAEDALEKGLTDELVSLNPGDTTLNEEGDFEDRRRSNRTRFFIEM